MSQTEGEGGVCAGGRIMPEERTVSVSEADAEYIIQRQRQEINSLRSALKGHLESELRHLSMMVADRLKHYPWLSSEQLEEIWGQPFWEKEDG